jgi:hypothetical protein
MDESVWLGVGVAGVMIAIGLVIAFTRKGSVAATRLGSRVITLTSPVDPASAYARLLHIAGYKVDDASPDARTIILSSPPTFATWGFLYPVVIHPAGTGSRLELGIHSKVLQLGPLVTRAHTSCAAAIEATLAVPAARIASP